MTKSLEESARSAYSYLDSIGEQMFYISGKDAVTRLNMIMLDLRESLEAPKPCACVSPERCNLYDRCCRND